MSYMDDRRKFIEQGRPLPPKKKYIIPKKSAKRSEKEKDQKIEIVKPKKAVFFDVSKVDDVLVNDHEFVEEDGVDESLQNLSNDLDWVLSQYIRYKNADKDGNCTCFTCGIKLPISKMQNGHYKKRIHKALRFAEQNMRCQCPPCNSLHNTNEEPYKAALEAEYSGITTWLDEQAATVYKATRVELKQALIEYRDKLEVLKRKFETK